MKKYKQYIDNPEWEFVPVASKYSTGGWATQKGSIEKGYSLYTGWSAGNNQTNEREENSVKVRTVLPKVPREFASAVLENAEIAMIPTKDGMGVQKADSGSHASGNDHPTMLEEGSMIISDTKSLKEKDPAAQSMFNKPYKKGGYTYTELAKPYMGVFNRAEKALNNKDMSIDPMKEKTVALNQQNAMNKLQQVFQLQEMRKQERGIGTGPVMAAGGQYKGPYSPTYYQQQQHLQNKPQAVMLANMFYGQPDAGQYADGIPGYRTDFVENYSPNVNTATNSNIGILPAVDGTVTAPMQQRMNPVTIPNSLYPQSGTGTDKTKRGKDRGVRGNISAANISDAVTAAKLLSIKKHLPWEPAVNVKYPDMLLESDQPIRNVLAEQTNQLSNAMYSGDSKVGRAAAQNAQSELLRRSVQAAGEVGNRNVNTYNQFSQLRSQLGTAEEAAKRDRAKRIYDGTIIANQQYTNAMNAGLDVVAKTAAEREEQAAFLHNQNMTNPYYQLDRTGKLRWNPGNTREKFLSDMAARNGSMDGSYWEQLNQQIEAGVAAGLDKEDVIAFLKGNKGSTTQSVSSDGKGNTKKSTTTKTQAKKYGGYMNKLPKK